MRYRSAWKIQRHSGTLQSNSHLRVSILCSFERFEPVSRSRVFQSRFVGTYTKGVRRSQCRRSRISLNTNSHDTIPLSNRAFRCLQHTQARRTEEEREDDDLGSAASELLGNSDEAPGNKAKDETTTSDVDDSASPAAEPARQVKHVKSDRLLHIVEKFLSHVEPVVKIEAITLSDDTNASLDIGNACHVELFDDNHGISCTATILAAENLQEHAEKVFETLADQYGRQLLIKLKKNESYNGNPKPYPIRKLLELLELSPISTQCEPIEISNIGSTPLHLYRAQIYAGQEPLGQAQIWADPGTAERLARASADLDVWRRAIQAGIDVELIRSQFVNTHNVKKKRSYELPRARPRDLPRQYRAPISQECLETMLYTLRRLRHEGLPDQVEMKPFKPIKRTKTPRPLIVYNQRKRSLEPSAELQTILDQRNELPIRQPQTSARICSLIEENDVVILVSETGSGKTTQLPQILLEEAQADGRMARCNVLCTQPRRIAATSVAARVAKERDTHIGGSVGYHVRFDCRVARLKGSITYLTAGVLIKRLQDEANELLTEHSHIVVDEVHERDLTVDLLMVFLRDLLWKRKSNNLPCPKIVIMSATMKATDFEKFFAEQHDGYTPRVASITIPGRTYSVAPEWLDDIIPDLAKTYANNKHMMSLLRDDKEYLEWEDEFAIQTDRTVKLAPRNSNDTSGQLTHLGDEGDPFQDAFVPYSLMIAVAIHILRSHQQGDILIFLPGMREIDALQELLAAKAPADLDLQNSEKFRVFKLHSALSDTNADVFKPIPEGCRRIILATNIAQTSITLPDVVHVIDSGKRRKMTYDQISRKNEFSSTWVDQATSFQRRGRAGRLRNGHYWAVFSKARFDSMSKRALPDILTSDLTTSSLILKSHSDDVDLREFFARAVDAPDPAIVNACIKELVDLGMLTADERITPLGKFCSDFPLHPARARGLIIGLMFNCFTPLMLIACHDPNSPLIYAPVDKRGVYRSTLEFADVSDDDRYAFIQAFIEYDGAIRHGDGEELSSLERKYIRRDAYNDMKRVARQLYEILTEEYCLFSLDALNALDKKDSIFGLIPHMCNRLSHRITVFKALALSVVNTNIAVWDEEEQSWLSKDIKCMLRPYSVNTMSSLRLLEREPLRQSGEVVGFSEMVRNVLASPRPFLYETSSITPLMAMLFGGPIVAIDQQTIEIDGWLRYRIDVTPSSTQSAGLSGVSDYPAMVILEFRKAFDRLITQTVSTLRNLSRMPEDRRSAAIGTARLSSRHLCSIMRRQLTTILEADAEQWEEKEWLKNNKTRKT